MRAGGHYSDFISGTVSTNHKLPETRNHKSQETTNHKLQETTKPQNTTSRWQDVDRTAIAARDIKLKYWGLNVHRDHAVGSSTAWKVATTSENTRLVCIFFTLQCKGVGFGEENMKYENFREIQNSMRAVTINSEFSLPGLIIRHCFGGFYVI